jgi:hypothetical protein
MTKMRNFDFENGSTEFNSNFQFKMANSLSEKKIREGLLLLKEADKW